MSTVTDVTDVTDFSGNGGATLDAVRTFLERFIAYPSADAAIAHTLWIAHTHAVDAFENTPRIAFLSPEPGSGKSRALELTEALVPRPVLSVNASTAYIFRKISDEAGLPTLLLDEVDSIFTGGKSDANEDLRGLLNSGYRKGATAGRAAIRGKEIVTEEWPSYCPVALAGLNQLPDTLMTRSVIIPMKRRRHDQRVEPFRRRVNGPEAAYLYDTVQGFIDGVRQNLEAAWPDLPEGIEDRAADIWEPLLAVADAAGDHWPHTARMTALAMVAEAQNKPATLGIRLLADIRIVMGDRDRISTGELLIGLHDIDTAPWGSIKGEPIDARFLARTLGKYEIPTNTTIRIEGNPVKGYAASHFFDAWERYLPSVTDQTEGVAVILNKKGSILNRGDDSGSAPDPSEVGYIGYIGNGEVEI